MLVAQEDADCRRWLWIIALGFEESPLELEDIVAEGIVLVLDDFVVVFEGVEFADLIFELFYVGLFAMTEGALGEMVSRAIVMVW